MRHHEAEGLREVARGCGVVGAVGASEPSRVGRDSPDAPIGAPERGRGERHVHRVAELVAEVVGDTARRVSVPYVDLDALRFRERPAPIADSLGKEDDRPARQAAQIECDEAPALRADFLLVRPRAEAVVLATTGTTATGTVDAGGGATDVTGDPGAIVVGGVIEDAATTRACTRGRSMSG